jgi:Calcineurin-like phosphoesterase superfamily domain
MRIGLIGDTHGWVPALESALAACRAAGADVLVHCGDFLSTPFSSDPPGETIALLRRAGVRCVYGNGELYLRDWGTARWEATLAARLARSDPPRPGVFELVPAGQAELSADDLAWLRAVPEELVLDGARPGDVYVCHGMPGNVFNTLWPRSPVYDGNVTDATRLAALARPAVAGADLILCGHAIAPYVQPEVLPNGRRALVVRASGWPRQDDGIPRTSVALLTSSAAGWEVVLRPVTYAPRDATWRWDQRSRRPA